MQVTCPNCRARYAVDPLAIGPAGRTVQCARCHDRWFQMVERERPVPDLVIRPPPQSAVTGASADMPGRVSLPAVIEPKASTWGKVLAAAAVALVVAVVAALLFAIRNDVVAWLPNEWRLMLQSDASPSGGPTVTATAATKPAPAPTSAPMPASAQLEIDLAVSKIELVDGRFVMRGEIVNTGRAAGAPHSLRLIFKKQEDVLSERAYSLVEGPIAPGARLSFSQPIDDPPSGTTDIVPNIE